MESYHTELLGCPISPEDGDTIQNRLQRAAQEIIDQPENIADILQVYKTELKNEYALMIDNRPGMAAEKIARRIRGAYLAPLYHCVAGRLAQLCMHEYRKGGLPEYIRGASRKSIDYTSKGFKGGYSGIAGQYMQGMVFLYDEAYCSLYTDRTSRTGQLFHNLIEYEPTINSMMIKAAKISDNPQFQKFWSDKPGSYEVGAWSSFLETIHNSFSLMQATHAALLASGSDYPAEALRLYVIENLPTIHSMASTRRNAIRRILPLPDEWAQIEYNPYKEQSVFSVDDNNALKAVHHSLQDGPWDPAGGCGGLPELSSPDSGVAEDVDDFYVLNGLQPPKEGFDSLTVELPVAGLVAERTIFQPRALRPAA